MKFISRQLPACLMLCAILFSGCKRPAEPAAAPEPAPTPEPVRSPSKPSAVVEPPKDSPIPVSTPADSPERFLYVNSPFQAVSEKGTHEFPLNAKVTLIEIDGDDYVVEYNGVSVRNDRSYFSDQPVEPPAATPDAIGLGSPAPEPSPSPVESLTAEPAPSEEERRNAQTLEDIRMLNEEIRSAQQGNQNAEAEKLKKRRDQLSEELTKTAKP